MQNMSKAEFDALPKAAQELIASMQAKLDQAKADAQRKVTLKVSPKGAVSLYGLGRFPVTLYSSQWERLIEVAKSGQIERFMVENKSLLSVKD